MPTRCDICPGRPAIYGADEMVTVTCNAGHRFAGPPTLVGQECWVRGCGAPWRLVDEVDERIRRHEAERTNNKESECPS